MMPHEDKLLQLQQECELYREALASIERQIVFVLRQQLWRDEKVTVGLKGILDVARTALAFRQKMKGLR